MLGVYDRVRSAIRHLNDGAVMRLFRERPKSGSRELVSRVRSGPNHFHAWVQHADGTMSDLGVSKNLLTNIGRDWWAQAWGFRPAGVTLASLISTAVGATSITDTGSVMTASNLATPQLGVAGLRVYAAPHTTTNPVVWGNAVSNTTHVVTIDQWWKAPAAALGVPITGTTPTSGDAYVIAHGGQAAACFVALTADSGAASASDTVLASEQTGNGLGRALGTYAHTYGQSTLTLTNAFSVTGTVAAVHKAGLFSCLTAAGADPMLYETVLNADASVVNGDTLNTTWTFTLSG